MTNDDILAQFGRFGDWTRRPLRNVTRDDAQKSLMRLASPLGMGVIDDEASLTLRWVDDPKRFATIKTVRYAWKRPGAAL